MGLGLRKEGVVGGEAAGSGSWRPGCSLIRAECTGVSPWILREPEPDDLHSLVCYTSVNILLKIKKKGKKPCFFFHILYVLDFKTKAAWFELMGKIFSSSERRGRNGLDFLVEYFPWSQALCYIVLHWALPHLVLSAGLWNDVLTYPHLINGETEAQKMFRNVEKLVLLCMWQTQGLALWSSGFKGL